MNVRAGELLGGVLALACALGIALVQPGLARRLKAVRPDAEVTALPPPNQLKAMVLGYDAAGADILWAKLLVEHGVSSSERRPFPGAPQYVDAIVELDANHPVVYQFVDTLLVGAKAGGPATADDARLVRRQFERGTHDRPFDHDLWLEYGQFLAFLAPSFLEDNAEIDRWRIDGARAIARAVELGADTDRTLAASTILSRSGEEKAAIQQLQRAYALTDNPDTRLQITMKLARLKASSDSEDVMSRVENEWHDRFPFLTRGAALLVGPSRPTAECVGLETHGLSRCAGDWPAATLR